MWKIAKATTDSFCCVKDIVLCCCSYLILLEPRFYKQILIATCYQLLKLHFSTVLPAPNVILLNSKLWVVHKANNKLFVALLFVQLEKVKEDQKKEYIYISDMKKEKKLVKLIPAKSKWYEFAWLKHNAIHTTGLTRITSHSNTPIDNIFSNVIDPDIISGNLSATISSASFCNNS